MINCYLEKGLFHRFFPENFAKYFKTYLSDRSDG